jgi:hypothetical protein
MAITGTAQSRPDGGIGGKKCPPASKQKMVTKPTNPVDSIARID